MVCSSLHTQGSNFRFSRKVNGRSLSPLARGTLRNVPKRLAIGRFIPACAGNSTSWLMPLPTGSVHPRLRGELCTASRIGGAPAGSSPLARGTRVSRTGFSRRRRFIPACAGNSTRVGTTGTDGAVHPRLRGELT